MDTKIIRGLSGKKNFQNKKHKKNFKNKTHSHSIFAVFLNFLIKNNF